MKITSASVKMFITKDEKQQLLDLGYSSSAVDKMKPEEGASIISSGKKAPPISGPTKKFNPVGGTQQSDPVDNAVKQEPEVIPDVTFEDFKKIDAKDAALNTRLEEVGLPPELRQEIAYPDGSASQVIPEIKGTEPTVASLFPKQNSIATPEGIISPEVDAARRAQEAKAEATRASILAENERIAAQKAEGARVASGFKAAGPEEVKTAANTESAVLHSGEMSRVRGGIAGAGIGAVVGAGIAGVHNMFSDSSNDWSYANTAMGTAAIGGVAGAVRGFISHADEAVEIAGGLAKAGGSGMTKGVNKSKAVLGALAAGFRR